MQSVVVGERITGDVFLGVGNSDVARGAPDDEGDLALVVQELTSPGTTALPCPTRQDGGLKK
jgi:hypothetical protein